MKASQWYRLPVNHINQERHEDGTVTVTIYKEGWQRAYTFKARKLDQPGEKILQDEEVREAEE